MSKKNKNILTIILSFVLVLLVSLMVACGATNKPANGKETEIDSSNTGTEKSEIDETEIGTEETSEIETSTEEDTSSELIEDTEDDTSADTEFDTETENSGSEQNEETTNNTDKPSDKPNEGSGTGNNNNSNTGNPSTGSNNESGGNTSNNNTGSTTQKPSDNNNVGNSNSSSGNNNNAGNNNSDNGSSDIIPDIEIENKPGVIKVESSKEAFDLINEERVRLGLEPAVWDETCERIALLRAEEIALLGTSELYEDAHAGIQKYKEEHPYIGECVAWGYTSAEGVVNGWMNSTGHRNALMMYDAVKLAVARWENKWVAINNIDLDAFYESME